MNQPDEPSNPTPALPPDSLHQERPTSGSPEDPRDPDGPASDTLDASAGDDLPEYEPLTPELVEEEAIRGDIMLRWAAVLIAMLLGWTVIDETGILVQIKSGLYLATHGWLPPVSDVLSSTATDRPWINLSWLTDLILAGVYGVGGFALLSALNAILAAMTFWILGRISLPGVSTWWGSVCAVLAAIACFPYFTPGPEIVSLLGVALTLAWIHAVSREGALRSVWLLAALLAVWSNLDARAWLGLAILLTWAIGESLQGLTRPETTEAVSARQAWTAVALGAVALLINPFHIHAMLSAVVQYTVEYPALQAFGNPRSPFRYTWLSMGNLEFWSSLNYFGAAGLLLMMVTLITLLLNREQLRISDWLLYLLATGLAIANGHELGVASLINCSLATVHAQSWYRQKFRQEYSVELGELLFSRGGRAVTVLAFFALGFAAVSGHLMGADGRRVGMGLSTELKNQLDSLEEVVTDSFDDRPFNFVLPQGDQLIWLGERPFADSRVRLFGRPPSLLDELQAARLALRQSREGVPGTGLREDWQRIFDDHGTTHILPRLTPPTPDYLTFRDLLQSPDWVMTQLGASAACFYRTDRGEDEALSQYLGEHAETNLVADVFRGPLAETEITSFRAATPRPPSLYDQLVFLPPRVTPNDHQVLQHRAEMLQSGRLPVDAVLALAYEALRRAHVGFSESPNSGQAYISVARIYQVIDRLERQILQTDGVQISGSLRYFQILSSYQMALNCDPFNPYAHYGLFQTYLGQRQIDLALKHLLKFQDLTQSLTDVPRDSPAYELEQERGYEVLVELEASLERIREQKAQHQQDGKTDPLTIIQSLVRVGCPGLALEVLEEDLTIIAGKPELQLLYGQLLLESGRITDANLQIQGLESVAESANLRDWPTMASLAAVSEGNLVRAVDVLKGERQRLTELAVGLLTNTSPLGPPMPVLQPDLSPDWSAALATTVQWQLRSFKAFQDQIEPQLTMNSLRSAQIALEMGRNADAADLFRQIIERNPASPIRALVRAYLTLLTGQDIGPRPAVEPSEEADLFAPVARPDDAEPEASALPETGDETAPPETTTPPASRAGESTAPGTLPEGPSAEEAPGEADSASTETRTE